MLERVLRDIGVEFCRSKQKTLELESEIERLSDISAGSYRSRRQKMLVLDRELRDMAAGSYRSRISQRNGFA